MKMIMAIVQPKDSNRLRDAFNDAKIGATKLSSTGGFLRGREHDLFDWGRRRSC